MDSFTSPTYQFLYAILFLLSTETKVFCFQYQVGDLNCWGVPPSGNPFVYVNWSNKNFFNHGDSLFFLYPPSQDSVLQVTQQAYQTCDITDPILSMNNGNSLFNITQQGVLYFISGAAGNCRNNQKLQVCIHSKGTCAYYTPPLPAPAPSHESHSIVSGSISTAPSSSWSIRSPIKLVLAAVGLVVLALLMLFLFQKCSNSSRYAKLQQDHTF